MNTSQRAFEDIRIMADRIQRGDNVDANLEHLARFSEEMKTYLTRRTENAEVLSRLQTLPVITYKTPGAAHYFFAYALRIFLGRKLAHQLVNDPIEAQKEAREQAREIATGYASIHFLLLADED